jgi:type I restriction enzyme S subunit
LGEVATIHPGQHILEADYNSKGVGVGYLTGPMDFGAAYPSVSKWTERPKAWCQCGDILLTVKGAGVGKANMAPDDRVAIGRQLMAIRPSEEHADKWLLLHYLRFRFSEFQKAALGATVPGLGRRDVETLSVPLPDILEQRRLATVLNEQMASVAQARVAAEARLAAAKALAAAHLREVFDGAEARRWRIQPLGEVGNVVSGVTLGRKLNGASTRPISYLRVANVKDGHLDLADVKEIEATESEIDKWRLQRGDLLLTEGGDPDKLGRGTYWQEEIPECIHQNHIFRVRFDKAELLPEFISAQLGSPYGKRYFLAHAKQTTGIATINQRVLKAFPLRVPELPEQRRIVATLDQHLSGAERLRQAAEVELAAIDALPAALLRRAFSGEL